MTSAEIRKSYLEFFRENGHTIVPSASLMPDSPNLLFTNAGMNQFVPIFLGERACPYDPRRATDTQKCVRAGGKHNDLDDVGLDTYHHTFFEMLGNWSFGDYFKAEAIDWAWKLVVERWGFPANRIYATIYSPGPGDPGEFDTEAHAYWAEKFSSLGLDPAVHIVNGNKKDNFWMMGDTGPCGPCSELHVDLTPDGDTRGALVNAGDPRCIEIWNLVFIQYNANPDGTFSPLPARHVDTGMGFERVTSIIQGTNGFRDFANARISNYESDIFRPIFDEIGRLSGRRYGSTLPGSGAATEADDIAFRVIADHIRTLSFAIADGIQPGNSDRNYVLRRILRRAVRYGRTLGFQEPFFYKLTSTLSDTMGDVFPEIRTRRAHVEDVLRMEEESFLRTLDNGIALFEAEAERLASSGIKEISGAFAFRLYDEQGFPLDLTGLMARERGLSIDQPGFETLMEEQRSRARAAQKKEVIELSSVETKEPTQFIGYEKREAQARVLEVVRVKDRLAVILDTTPCFAEMGGQVGDTGSLQQGARSWTITGTRKAGDAILHFIDGDEAPDSGASALATVDARRRLAIERHHSVTHLLHWALHEVVSREATQKGSFVGPEKLTFDFNSSALTPAQVRDIERLVNERILENSSVSTSVLPYAEVKARTEIMQFFGDKYGDEVRVVQIGGQPFHLDGYSMELCGGTHVRATGEVGSFRILSEAAIASGVRRIEAVAGWEAIESAIRDSQRLAALAESLNSPIGDIEKKLSSALEHNRQLEKSLRAARQREAAATAASLEAAAACIDGIPSIVARLDGLDGDQLQDVAEALKSRFHGMVVLIGTTSPQEVALVASASPAHAKTCPAGKLISALAPLVGGKGGGRPEMARGAGKDAGGIPAALDLARQRIAQSAG
ncbi:MAG: alanine--tRNA ligase [Terrimicrobiaceae bacterium]